MTDRRVIECSWEGITTEAPKEFVVTLRLRAPADRTADAVAEQLVSFLNDETSYEVDRCEATTVARLSAADLATRPGRRAVVEPLMVTIRGGVSPHPDTMRSAIEPVGEAMFSTGDHAAFGELVTMFVDARGREDLPPIVDFLEGWILRAAEVTHAQ